MRMYDIILKKKEGKALSREEINYFISGYTAGEIPDYQASALAMAICFQGMTDPEIVYLTEAMAASGDMMDLSRFGNLSVDKHSTGGVGDKTTLIVAPIVASLGCKVTKMSGRGLGHTGGTVDKLESIPGYRTTLSEEEFMNQVERIGVAVIGQSGNLTPADKKLYALRDVTATVDSIPLITSSIMSKKLAAGSHSIVLDVKVGSGAFMKTPEDAKMLAGEMVRIGKHCGRNMAALLTSMDAPLGNAIGNALEVMEAVNVLKGESKGDLYEVCVALASEMVMLVHGWTAERSRSEVEHAIDSAKAYETMLEWIAAQGGDIRYIRDTSLFPKAEVEFDVVCDRYGYITSMDAEQIGSASVILGAGRASKEDKIDFSAGIVLHRKTGDRVKKGDVLCTLYAGGRRPVSEAAAKFLAAVNIGDSEPEKKPLIYGIVR